MSHLEVSFASSPPASTTSGSGQIFNAPVLVISGDHTNIAWDGGLIRDESNSQTVAPGFEALAQSVARALEIIASDPGLDDDEKQIGRESADEVLREVVKDEPDKGRLKRSLVALRGVLLAITTAGAAEAVKDIVARLAS